MNAHSRSANCPPIPSSQARKPAIRTRAHPLTTLLMQTARRWYHRYQGRKAAEQLMKLDDRMLKDIGLTRGDAIRVQMSRVPEEELRRLQELPQRHR